MSAPALAFKTALLVEDETHLAAALTIALRKLNIEPERASTLKSAREAVARIAPDLIVLDLTLPDGDGIDLCRELRANDFRGAILMLTARGRTEDRVAGLNVGADDYLAKPFSWEELEARIRALSRLLQRTPASPKTWQCDETRLRILGPQGWVELTPLEFKLAVHLMSAGGAIVSRDDLLKEVWGFTLLPKTRTVDHFMGRLRKLFEADPEDPKFFLTVRGAGYRFQPK